MATETKLITGESSVNMSEAFRENQSFKELLDITFHNIGYSKSEKGKYRRQSLTFSVSYLTWLSFGCLIIVRLINMTSIYVFCVKETRRKSSCVK